MAQASVYVLPSYYREGVPASTQEAMAMGRPVITTDVPGCRETVVDGVNGFFGAGAQCSGAGGKDVHLHSQPDLIASMGQASRLAEDRFDVHKVNQRLLDVLLNPSTTSKPSGL